MQLPILSHIQRLFQRNPYLFSLACIVILGALLRLYHFDSRWGLSADSARDAAIAQQALSRLELPLTASFSSAGPFVFAPTFYWLIMASFVLLPVGIISPWIMTFLFGLGLIGLFAWIGLTVGNKKVSLLLGFMTAVSPQMILNAAYLTQHTFVIVTATAALLCFIRFVQRGQLRLAFLTGLFIGLAISFHYQALNLVLFVALPIFVITLPIGKRIAASSLMALGMFLPMTPLLYWDSYQHFANIRNILDYFLIVQHSLYVPMNWRIFALELIPSYWSSLIGGPTLFSAGMLIATFSYFSLFSLKQIKTFIERGEKKTLSSTHLALLLLFGLFVVLLILNRYYKGERFEGYLLYLSPFVLLFSTYVLFKLSTLSKALVVLIMMLLTYGGISAGVSSAPLANNLYTLHSKSIAALTFALPNTSYTVYDYEYSTIRFSQPLSLMLSQTMNIKSKGGHKIGICDYCPGEYKTLVTSEKYRIVDLESELFKSNKKSWGNVDPASMYDDLIGWAKRHELTSSFSLEKYVLERLPF